MLVVFQAFQKLGHAFVSLDVFDHGQDQLLSPYHSPQVSSSFNLQLGLVWLLQELLYVDHRLLPMNFFRSFISFLGFLAFWRAYAVDQHVLDLQPLLLFDVDSKLPLTQNLMSQLVPLEPPDLSLHHFVLLNYFSRSWVLELLQNGFVFSLF